MPKTFQYTCGKCGTQREEMFNISELPDGHVSPDYLDLDCKLCGVKTLHERTSFSSNPHRAYVNDSPYGGKVRG